MGQNVILKSENCVLEISRSKFVGSSSTHSKRFTKDRKIQPTNRCYCLESSEGDFRELNHGCSLGSQDGSMPSKTFRYPESPEVLKRGSMYQSSTEVTKMGKEREERRKIDSAYCDDAFLSFDIGDSLPHSPSNAVRFSDEKRSALVSSNSKSKPSDIGRSPSISTRPVDNLELSFRDLPDKRLSSGTSCSGFISENVMSAEEQLENYLNFISETDYTYVSPEFTEVKPLRKKESDYGRKFGPEGFDVITFEKDALNLTRSLSAKDEKTCIASQVDHNVLTTSNKSQFNSLDPVSKSKLFQALSPMKTERARNTLPDLPNSRRNRKFRKSLLTDFSKATTKPRFHPPTGEDQTTASSPTHLHGILKVEDIQNGSPSFKFSVEDPGDVLSAKSWRTGNAFNWVYTFHNSSKKIVNTRHTTRGSTDKHRPMSSVVGQMQVSCYLCSEVRESGSLANSLITEFISYDIAQARRNFPIQEKSQFSSNSIHPLMGNDIESLDKVRPRYENNYMEHGTSVRNGLCSSETDSLTSYPSSPEDLHPHHEIAAIMIQVPFNKKENSKDLKNIMKEKQSFSTSPAIMKVITPTGTHGLPDNNEDGPSSLIDRMRFGGGCDCGGWDMGCPISVFENSHPGDCKDHSLESQKPMLLFLQGSKENLPAVSMTADGKGQYMVDFHARLSTLQAFSICIAILHSSEVSSAVIEENNRQRLYTSSLKLLLEEELRHLVEAFTNEEKCRLKNGAEQTQSFFLDPPFSPISRS